MHEQPLRIHRIDPRTRIAQQCIQAVILGRGHAGIVAIRRRRLPAMLDVIRSPAPSPRQNSDAA
jgi:hypothetical protein